MKWGGDGGWNRSAKGTYTRTLQKYGDVIFDGMMERVSRVSRRERHQGERGKDLGGRKLEIGVAWSIEGEKILSMTGYRG